MKKLYLTLLQLAIAFVAFSHPPPNDFDFSIIFSGPFKNDLVSISINKQQVINKFKVENVNPENKGHLNLTQNANNIIVHYNGAQLKKPKIAVSFIVALEIAVNGHNKKIDVDLRKGKVIVISNQVKKAFSDKWNVLIEQITEPIIFF